jgi:hypothetical protein
MHFMSEKRDKAPGRRLRGGKRLRDSEISEISEIGPTRQGNDGSGTNSLVHGLRVRGGFDGEDRG